MTKSEAQKGLAASRTARMLVGPRRRSRRTAAQHVTYWDPFPLAQWQRNSSRDSRLVAKPAPPTGALVLHEPPIPRQLLPAALCERKLLQLCMWTRPPRSRLGVAFVR
jgi:hypothetical protein